MKMETKIDSERIFLDGLVAVLAMMCGVLLCMLAAGVHQLYLNFGLWVILLPPGVVIFWAIGHVAHGMTNMVDEGEKTRCDGCNYHYRNIFSEWWHKRSCLPWITKKV